MLDLSNYGKNCVNLLFNTLGSKTQEEIENKYGKPFYRYFRKYHKSGHQSKYKYLVFFTVDQVTNEIPLKDKTVLDLGCGFGIRSIILSQYDTKRVVGVDINNERLAGFKLLKNGLNIPVSIRCNSASNMHFKNNVFDIVYCNEFISHVHDLTTTLSEIYRVLKKGGFVFISDENAENVLEKFFLFKIYKKYSNQVKEKINNIIQQKINEKGYELRKKEISKLVQYCMGFSRETIIEIVEKVALEKKEPKEVLKNYERKFPYRDPYTGYYHERLFTPAQIEERLKKTGFDGIKRYIPLPYYLRYFSPLLKINFFRSLLALTVLPKYYVWAIKK
jgi:ubiquinone/menaquinone biosynthesis C-methylase UbiE